MTWSQLLLAVPKSRLMLLCPDSEWSRQRVEKHFTGAGVDMSRIALVGWSSRKDYIDRYQEIDIALDPIPFNGHTTTCDALWMGVPVVSLAGNAYVSRYGSVAITQIGHGEWIARTTDDYTPLRLRSRGTCRRWKIFGARCGIVWRDRRSAMLALSRASSNEHIARRGHGIWQTDPPAAVDRSRAISYRPVRAGPVV